MGMDFHLWKARNSEVFKHDEWYNSPEIEEVFYGRKAWHYPEYCSFMKIKYESGEFLPMTRKNLEEMIRVACEHRNHWDNYDDVPQLCEIRDQWDELENAGYKIFYEYDY